MKDYKELEADYNRIIIEKEDLLKENERLINDLTSFTAENKGLKEGIKRAEEKVIRDKAFLNDLKELLKGYKPDWTRFTNKDRRRYQDIYEVEIKTILTKIEKIEIAKEQVEKYEKDIAEILARFKKMKDKDGKGFEFIDEYGIIKKEAERKSPVL